MPLPGNYTLTITVTPSTAYESGDYSDLTLVVMVKKVIRDIIPVLGYLYYILNSCRMHGPMALLQLLAGAELMLHNQFNANYLNSLINQVLF